VTPVPFEAADAIDRLRRTKDGQVFATYLNTILKEVMGRLIQDDDQLRFRALQGEARVLKALTDKWSPPAT